MTDNRLPPLDFARESLAERMAKTGDGDFLRSVAESVLRIIMEADVDGLIGAGRHERSGERSTWRNGYRDRSLDTRLGTLDLKIPKLRTGARFPGCLEPAERWRRLAGEWPYLWLDATYLKVREGGRIVSVAAMIAVTVATEGKREIVGLHIGPSEAEPFWSTFLRDLVRRGPKGGKLVIPDAHEGLKAAITRVVGATWQRCRVHFMRNALAPVPKGQNTMVAAAIRQVFQPDHTAATRTWRHVANQLRARWPKLGACMDNAEHEPAPDLIRGARLHDLSRAAPGEVALNQPIGAAQQGGEAPCRCRGISALRATLPSEDSFTRLIGAVFLEQNDEYRLQNRSMQIEGMAALDSPQIEEVSPLQITPKAA